MNPIGIMRFNIGNSLISSIQMNHDMMRVKIIISKESSNTKISISLIEI